MGEIRMQRMKGRDHSEDVGVDGKIILEWALGK
jgi:hypothetical protein